MTPHSQFVVTQFNDEDWLRFELAIEQNKELQVFK